MPDRIDYPALTHQLIRHEGIRLEVYEDTEGKDTIGVGRNVEDRGITYTELEVMGLTLSDVYSTGITYEDAMYLLMNDIEIAVDELFDAFPEVNSLSATRQQVLANMSFNLGIPTLKKFKKMWTAIRQDDFKEASFEMLDSKWARQVGNRARELAYMMRYDKAWQES